MWSFDQQSEQSDTSIVNSQSDSLQSDAKVMYMSEHDAITYAITLLLSLCMQSEK